MVEDPVGGFDLRFRNRDGGYGCHSLVKGANDKHNPSASMEFDES